ncbi:MAG: hypothetical protein ACYC0V_10790 [Armatimonadota bacterium]
MPLRSASYGILLGLGDCEVYAGRSASVTYMQTIDGTQPEVDMFRDTPVPKPGTQITR